MIERGRTRNDCSASTRAGHPRCSSIPSCWLSMLRGVHLRASRHLLSELAERASPRLRQHTGRTKYQDKRLLPGCSLPYYIPIRQGKRVGAIVGTTRRDIPGHFTGHPTDLRWFA